MGSFLKFFRRPLPAARIDLADDRLAAGVNVDVLDRHLLLTLAAITLQRLQLRRECAQQLDRKAAVGVLL